jgi:BlaI family transcriptional regulator, penicillinase repressor
MASKRTTTQLTRREREIVDILYRRGRATAHEVLANMKDAPSYSAVRALLRLLEERGHARHVVEGTRYVYTPQIARSDARRSAIAHLVRTFFGGNAGDAITALVDTTRSKLTDEELDRIAALVERAKKEGR